MLERGVGFKGFFSDFRAHANTQNIGAGIVAAIFGLSAGVIHISAGTAAGLPVSFIMAWVTSKCFINGFFGLLVPAYYRKPLPMANSLPGALMFAAAIPMVGLGPVVGATFLAGIITMIIGLSGLMGKVMKLTPTPIVLGMIGGVLLRFGINLVTPLQNAFLPTAFMIIVYLLFAKFVPKFPAVLASLFAGVIWLLASGTDFSGISLPLNYPRFVTPEFTLEGFLAYGLPLTVILVAMDTPVSVGIVKAAGHDNVPINGVTFANGLGTAFGALFSLHSTVVAAPMSGICTSQDAGKKEGHWVAAFIVGVTWVLVAPFYATAVRLFQIMPPFFINVIAGLALIRVLITTIGGALGTPKHSVGALFAFLIAASGITLVGVGAPFWALTIGILVSLVLETKDFEIKPKLDI